MIIMLIIYYQGRPHRRHDNVKRMNLHLPNYVNPILISDTKFDESFRKLNFKQENVLMKQRLCLGSSKSYVEPFNISLTGNERYILCESHVSRFTKILVY